MRDFEKLLSDLKSELSKCGPLQAISCLAYYGLSVFIDSDGKQKRLDEEVEQHHVELLQAIILSMPIGDWGSSPPTNSMSKIVDCLSELANSVPKRHFLNASKDSSEKARALEGLRLRILLDTQVVRNWDHYSALVEAANELYAPLEDSMMERLGFGMLGLIKLVDGVVKKAQERMTEHSRRLSMVLQGKTSQELWELYFNEFSHAVGDANEMLQNCPWLASQEKSRLAIVSHSDLCLPLHFTFDLESLSSLSDVPSSEVRRILEALSLKPEALIASNIEKFLLDNPVWVKPVIGGGDGNYFIPIPQMTFSHLHLVAERLFRKAGLTRKLERRRAAYLEFEALKALKSALPGATFRPNLSWQLDGALYETDFVVLVDRILIIVEAKSSKLTKEGMRASPQRMKRHVKDLMLKPSEQSARFADLVLKAKRGDDSARVECQRLNINVSKIDEIIRLSVTLDDMSVLYHAEEDLKKIGWIPRNHELPTTITLPDLKHVAEILENPICFIHYLRERPYLQKEVHIIGNEMDCLGFYLQHGIDTASVEGNSFLFAIGGMSGPIDQFQDARDSGIRVEKPKPMIAPFFAKILRKLEHTRPEGWANLGMHLLSCASFPEQIQVEQELLDLRDSVRCEWQDPEHRHTLLVQPNRNRKAVVAFHLFPRHLQVDSRRTATQISHEILDSSQCQMCCLFLICVDDWDNPFEAFRIVAKA